MKSIDLQITGITPLMLCAFSDEKAERATSGARSATHGDRGTPKEQAIGYLYKDVDGNPANVFPGPNVLACITAGGAFFKSGRSKITTQKSSLVPACLAILEPIIEIESKEGWTIDTRPVRIPATGGRVLCHRPLFNDWAMSFTMQLDDSLLTERLVRDIVDAAGTRCGLGAFRPGCKGSFGRFKVTHWASQELSLGIAA